MSKKVFIDVGHGGTDPGACANGLKEKNLNLAVAKAVNNELIRHGVSVMMSRTKDEADTTNDAVKECNKFNPDLAVSIHHNAGGGNGAEAYHHHHGGKGKTLANNILSEIVSIGQNSRGAKTRINSYGEDYYAIIRNTKAPTALIEVAFVDNAEDIKIVNSAAKQKTMGVAIAKGILKTLDIDYISEKAANNSKALYRVQVGAYKDKANAEATKKLLEKAGFSAVIVKS